MLHPAIRHQSSCRKLFILKEIYGATRQDRTGDLVITKQLEGKNPPPNLDVLVRGIVGQFAGILISSPPARN
jgi:hypothetical protein